MGVFSTWQEPSKTMSFEDLDQFLEDLNRLESPVELFDVDDWDPGLDPIIQPQPIPQPIVPAANQNRVLQNTDPWASGRGPIPPGLSREEFEIVQFLERYDATDLTRNPDVAAWLIMQHNLLPTNWEIADSKYGKGLYARERVGVGVVVGTYTGALVPNSWAHRLPDYYDKVIESPDNVSSIVGDLAPRGQPPNYVMYCNDPGYLGKGPDAIKLQPNAKFVEGPNQTVQLITIRPIAAGGEVLVSYGYEYWADNKNYWPSERERKNAKRESERIEKQRTLKFGKRQK